MFIFWWSRSNAGLSFFLAAFMIIDLCTNSRSRFRIITWKILHMRLYEKFYCIHGFSRVLKVLAGLDPRFDYKICGHSTYAASKAL